MVSNRAGIAALAAVVVVAAVALTASHYGQGPTELVETDVKKLFSKETHLTKEEMLAARAQDHLVLKDKRIFQSLAQAAQKKAEAAERQDAKFQTAREAQIVLDQRLYQLSEKLQAQQQALAYMAPLLSHRMETTEDLQSLVQQLQAVVPKIKPDLKNIKEQLQNIEDAGKQAKEQILTADEELAKYQNAYELFGKREYTAREQAARSRTEAEDLDIGAIRAQQYASQLREQATAARSSQEGKMLAAEAKREDARVLMLNKQATEAMQSTQLFDAEADEAAAYMNMFGSDAREASQRLKGESMKLEALSRQYKRGKYLEMSGEYRDQYLKAELAKAQQFLDKSELESENDKLAYMTGEKSTEETAREVQVEKEAAMGNTVKAEGIVEKLDKDKQSWANDVQQAESIKAAEVAHEDAAQHLEKAAELNP